MSIQNTWQKYVLETKSDTKFLSSAAAATTATTTTTITSTTTTTLLSCVIRLFYSMLFIVRLTQQCDIKLSNKQLHVSSPWGHPQAYEI